MYELIILFYRKDSLKFIFEQFFLQYRVNNVKI